MRRDQPQLNVFHDSHRLTLRIYRQTKNFPTDEWFGLRIQIRRAAVSVAANIVEGNARSTTRDYVKFLYVSLGSAAELRYLVDLAGELKFFEVQEADDLVAGCEGVVRQLQRLVQTMEALTAEEEKNERRHKGRKHRAADDGLSGTGD